MEQRTYHGDLTSDDVAEALIAAFNHGNMTAQRVGGGEKMMVQVATRRDARSGGKYAITVTVQAVEDGVNVVVGDGEWLGVAASLGQTAISALANPWSLLGRLDDLAQDMTSLSLPEKIWEEVERFAKAAKASKEISERLRTLACEHCNTANPVGASHCSACGAPLGSAQPISCPKCGNVLPSGSKFCSNCGTKLGA